MFVVQFVLAPVGIGVAIVVCLSFVPSRHRRSFGVVFLAGAGGAYLSSGGLGFGDVLFTAVMTGVAFLGLRSDRWLGVGWLLHTAWDAVHAAKGSPILPMAPHSSAGCAVCDPVIALWYFADAPSVPDLLRSRRERAGQTAETVLPQQFSDDVSGNRMPPAGQFQSKVPRRFRGPSRR